MSSVVAWGNVVGLKNMIGGLMIGGDKGIRKKYKRADKK